MRIGIVTLHSAHNYGAMIQAYCMQEYLLSIGHEAFIIDYEPSYINDLYNHKKVLAKLLKESPKLKDKLLTLIKELLLFGVRERRFIKFENFKNKYFHLYNYSPDNNYKTFDAILLGSDQIWNAEITGGKLDGVYFGEKFETKVFSYAASSKYTALSEQLQKEFASYFKSLHYIGVREKGQKKLFTPLTDKNIFLNIDPTLLVDSSLYEKLGLKRNCTKKYVLTYELTEHKEVIEMAKHYASIINAVVISIPAFPALTKIFDYKQTVSPIEFLSYIKFAECIFTTSFHGAALSIAMKKNFYSIRQGNSSDGRIESLLSIIGLNNRFLGMTEIPVVDNIDYSLLKQNLDTYISDSKNYIDKCLMK